MSNTSNNNDLAAQLAVIMGQIASNAGVNAAEVEKIVERKLAATPAIKHEYTLNGHTETVDGGHPVLSDVIDWVAVDCPVYLYGPDGSGKSSIGRDAAKALNLKLFQYGSLMSKYDVTGSIGLDGDYQRSAFRDWFEHGGLLVLDEIDGSDPRAIVAINDALRGRAGVSFAFPDQTVQKHKDCRVIVTANTIGKGANQQYVGRFKLDAASLNGFVQIHVDYDPRIEESLARGQSDWLSICRQVRDAAERMKIDMIVSPRQIDFGGRLLTSVSGDRVTLLKRAVDHCLKGGLSADQWSLIVTRVPALNVLQGA
jgi:MoxR-like ATPase